MKVKYQLLALLLLCTTFFGCSNKLTVRNQIQSVYDKWNTFSQNKDYDKLFALIHKDFTYTDETGKIENRNSFIERVRFALSNSRNINYKADILELKINADTVTTKIIYTIQLEFQQGEKWTAMNQKLNTSETFIKINNNWQLYSSKVLTN